MESAEFLTIGEIMSPQPSEGSLSLSGLPPEAITAIEVMAGEQGKTLRDVYTDIAAEFIAAVKSGEKPTYISTLRGSTRKTIWIEPDVAEELNDLCKALGRTRSSVMLTAIKRFLETREKAPGF